MRKIRFLVVDDHSVVRDGVRSVLRSSPDYRVVAEAEDGEQAVELARVHKPDVVIMDISMPKLNGIEATGIMKKENPGIKIVILTVHEDEEYVYQILRAGANGYVLKSAGKREWTVSSPTDMRNSSLPTASPAIPACAKMRA